MAARLAYLDSSAIVKLVVGERESEALTSALKDWPRRVSSVIAEVEVPRASQRVEGEPALQRAERVLDRLALIELDTEIRRLAVLVEPPTLSSFDAVHLATALSVRDEIGVFLTYDRRLADAAATAGLPVLSPA